MESRLDFYIDRVVGRKSKAQRRSSGFSLVEVSTSFVLFVPIILLVMLVIVEVNEAYLIHNNLTQAAQTAAYELGVVYASQTSSTTALSRAQQDAVYNTIAIPGVIAANTGTSQNPAFANAVFNTTSSPPTVTTTAMFVPGLGLLPFPFNKLSANWNSFVLPTNLTIKSSVTFPIPSKTNNSSLGG
jgi:hypothetical protein